MSENITHFIVAVVAVVTGLVVYELIASSLPVKG